MKKENKFIEDHPRVLDIHLEFASENKDGNVAFESDSKFVIVEEFSDGSKGFAFEESKYQEVESSKEGYVYAEEIFEDEDDIYNTQLNDRLVQKAAHRLFNVIGAEIDSVLLKNGRKGEVGLKLISSMQFSRLIHVNKHEETLDNLNKLNEALGVPFFHISKNGEENVAYTNRIYEAITFAKNNRNKPVFLYVDNLLSKEVFEYLRPLYGYIDNPGNDSYITVGGRNTNIPNNLWVMFSVNEGELLQNISRRIFRYTSILDFKLETVTATSGVEKAKVNISLEELRASLNEAQQGRVLLEESWKKIDSLFYRIGNVNGYSLHNKIALRMEAFAASLFCLNKADEDILDIVLSRSVINEAIITTTPEKYSDENDLFNELTNSFGGDKMPLTREVIKAYLTAAKGGKA